MELNDSHDNVSHKSDRMREFVGRVKIIFVDSPKRVYMRKRWAAAFITMSQMLIGVTNMIILFYVLSFRSKLLSNLHIFLCMIGFQLCIPAGILSLNSLNGSTIPMSTRDKKYEHGLLETFGLLCCIFGTAAIFLDRNLLRDIQLHALFGIAAGCLVVISAITGLCTKGKGTLVSFLRHMHLITGTLGFLSSSVCFILGLYRPCIENWVPLQSIPSFLMIFCCLYSFVVIVAPFRHIC